MLGSNSNEARLKGKLVVIKCAKPATNKIGVRLAMLNRLDAVIAAFQLVDRSFEVRSLPAAVFRAKELETRTQGAAARGIGLVGRSLFLNRGKLIRNIRTGR
jgi:hypothetical protein